MKISSPLLVDGTIDSLINWQSPTELSVDLLSFSSPFDMGLDVSREVFQRESEKLARSSIPDMSVFSIPTNFDVLQSPVSERANEVSSFHSIDLISFPSDNGLAEPSFFDHNLAWIV